MTRRLALLLALLAACGKGPPLAPDARVDPPPELAARAGDDFYADVGAQVILDGSASTGASLYRWDFGDGERQAQPQGDPVAMHAYAAPGRYQAVLEVTGEGGLRRTDAVVVSVTHPAVFTPRQASTITAIPGSDLVAAVVTDDDAVVIASAQALLRRLPTCDAPRTVSVWGDALVVACEADDAVDVLPIDGSPGVRVQLPTGARPYGVIAAGDSAFVTLAGPGEVARLDGGPGAPALAARLPAITDARGLAALPDGRLAVTRWRSPDDHAEILLLDPASGDREILPLAYDPQAPSDTEIGGVPSYLSQLLVSPTGREAVVPSLQANHGDGLFKNGRALAFETTVRAVVSLVALSPSATPVEQFSRRKQFDNRGLAAGGVLSPRGDYLYVTMPGNRAVERLDLLTGAQSGTILDVGFAPDGAALIAGGRLLVVNVALSRELVVYDVTSFDQPPVPRARIRTVDAAAEPLAADVLRGKQLFNDSTDPRLARDGYIACAVCHLEGLGDNRVWDFTDRGEGLRNTIPLVGRAGAGDGPIHWSANFDEVQDFEHDIRGPFGGAGLMTDADFHTGTRDTTLGDAKAGVSPDLDALAAYVTSLDTHLASPFPAGAAALRGQALFESPALGCATCHVAPRLTDSVFLSPGVPLLHDVGTLGPGSGQRLGGPLDGLDTPTLHGLWHSPPYLHDGSAATLAELFTTRNPGDLHGVTSTLTAADVDDLVAFLMTL